MFPDPRLIVAYASAMNALHSYFIAGSVMLLLWLYYVVKNNASIVDAGWAGSFFLIACYSLYAHEVHNPKLILLSVMFLLWSSRLLMNSLRNRVIGQGEDSRYVVLEQKWKKAAKLKFFLFFQAQALLAALLSLPLYLVRFDPKKEIMTWQILAFSLWLLSHIGQSVAEYQLKQFKKSKSPQEQTCRTGLWKYSRYPDSFYGWMIWVSYFIYSFPSPLGSLAFLPVLIMVFPFLRATRKS
jgi:steroid 5-alpha reductase family enzyme